MAGPPSVSTMPGAWKKGGHRKIAMKGKLSILLAVVALMLVVSAGAALAPISAGAPRRPTQDAAKQDKGGQVRGKEP